MDKQVRLMKHKSKKALIILYGQHKPKDLNNFYFCSLHNRKLSQTVEILDVFSSIKKKLFFLKKVLMSTKALDNTKRYAVGILSDQELHITPVVSSNLTQFKLF